VQCRDGADDPQALRRFPHWKRARRNTPVSGFSCSVASFESGYEIGTFRRLRLLTFVEETAMQRAVLFPCNTIAGAWRVEFLHDDGECEIAFFAGPNAYGRALMFADRAYGVFEEPRLDSALSRKVASG
jgi:hypothetical protein